MKHRVFGKKLGRNHNERQALLKSLVRSMFTHGSIETTEAKAKSVIPTVEKLCTVAKKADLSSKRELYRYLQDRSWVDQVVKKFAEVFGETNYNFTKTTRIKRRQGDDALIVKLQFTKPISFKEEAPVEAPKAKETKKAVKPQVKKAVKKSKTAKEA